MDDSITHPGQTAVLWTAPGWKSAAAAGAALLLAVLFVVAGVWKITDPFSAAQRMAQAKVPAELSLLAACLFGVAETFSGVLLVVPRFRRWGGWLAGLLLVAFMVYIAIFYGALRGEDCNCFPWVRRAVGPAFFIGDAIMLALAAIAAWWSRPSSGLRSAWLVLLAVGVFAAVSYGVNARMQGHLRAPAQIDVNGSPVSLREGRFLIYFFDPECTHCNQAARDMAALEWRDVRIIGVATEQPQYGGYFMESTGLKAPMSKDLAPLKKAFPFTAGPYAVAIENGRQRVALSDFEPRHMQEQLRGIGFIR
ncbi:MAG TPA: MauE/DoxX family redox-associated membrane protein [Bryobacteraceae bacterium]|nr:MauE/DoxX family redox-associated membrane protein [Bryobacteraceae bacterium]